MFLCVSLILDFRGKDLDSNHENTKSRKRSKTREYQFCEFFRVFLISGFRDEDLECNHEFTRPQIIENTLP